jgi:hypothetical protein
MFADGAMWHINEAHDNFNAGTKGRVYLQGEALEGQTLSHSVVSNTPRKKGHFNVTRDLQIETIMSHYNE